MQTKHYIVKNIDEFPDQVEAVKRLKEYLNCIEEKAFLAIEEVFGEIWNDGQIKIELNNSTDGAKYNSGIVMMGINNKNIQKKYPENLWGCLFHETHHAFLGLVYNKRDGKIFNGGHRAEVFNYAFMATTYLKLKEENKIDALACECFLSKINREAGECNRKNRASGKYEYERKLPDDAMNIFQEYIDLFSMSNEIFAKFILYVKSSDSVFTELSNFQRDLNEFKAKISHS